MTLRRSGIVKTEHFRIDGSTYTLLIPIEEAWTPNVHVQVDVVGAQARESNTGKDVREPQAGTSTPADRKTSAGDPAPALRRPASGGIT